MFPGIRCPDSLDDVCWFSNWLCSMQNSILYRMVAVSRRSSSIHYSFVQITRFLTGFSLYPFSGFTRRCVWIFQLIVFDAELNSLSTGSSFGKAIKHKLRFGQSTRFVTGFSWYPFSGFSRRGVLIFQLIVLDAELNSLSNGRSFHKVIEHQLRFCSKY